MQVRRPDIQTPNPQSTAQLPPATPPMRQGPSAHPPGPAGQAPAGQTPPPPLSAQTPSHLTLHGPRTADVHRPENPPPVGQAPVTAPALPPPTRGHLPVAPGLQPVPPPPVAVDTATTVVPRGDRNTFDIRRRNPDGSQIVITHTRRPDGTRQVTGFQQTEDAPRGTTTRIYADGRRVVQGPDFERRSVGGGLDFVTNRNGLREARLPDGRPAYRDRFTAYRDPGGELRRRIERSRYLFWSSGRPVYVTRPVVRQYELGHFHGVPLAYYRPPAYPSNHFRVYFVPFAVPVFVGAGTGPGWVDYGAPVMPYNDPAALMGDLQISSGFDEGYGYSVPWGAAPAYDTPEAAALREQMTTLQEQVNTRVQGDDSLRHQLGEVDVLSASPQVQQAMGAAVPIPISEEVRLQVRQQVRLSVAMLQNGHSMVLDDLLTSGYAKIYLFQTAQPLFVTHVSADAECFLNTGDLLVFSKPPAAGSPMAEMKVVASAAGSCRSGDLIQVQLTDLQDMLNAFTERVENNLKRVSACAASGAC